jgi:hypothetical protein
MATSSRGGDEASGRECSATGYDQQWCWQTATRAFLVEFALHSEYIWHRIYYPEVAGLPTIPTIYTLGYVTLMRTRQLVPAQL